MKKEIETLSKEELIDLVRSLFEKIETTSKFNKIELADFVVESNSENLSKCKSIMDSLVKKHFKFSTLRKEKINMERQGYLG